VCKIFIKKGKQDIFGLKNGILSVAHMGNKQLGQIVKEARSKLGLTQKELAEQAQVSTNWYARFERGEENASQQTRDIIFKILKIKISYSVD
jgi:ribosome-binding protein aMBF1 (putative translation factor)